MTSRKLLVILIILFIIGCRNDDHVKPKLGIGYSKFEAGLSAKGSVEQQNNGPKITHIVDFAYVRELRDFVYEYSVYFAGNDSLKIYFDKVTNDYNYHFPKSNKENRIISAVFNGDTLDLEESALSLQPRKEENTFHTVINLHTANKGDWNGTVNSVPLFR